MTSPINYTVVEMTDEQLEAERDLLGGLADAVRDLADASLRTTVPADVIAEVRAELEQATARLRAEQIPGSFGVSLSSGGAVRGYGNAVVGLRNPIAPPLHIEKSDGGPRVVLVHARRALRGPPRHGPRRRGRTGARPAARRGRGSRRAPPA